MSTLQERIQAHIKASEERWKAVTPGPWMAKHWPGGPHWYIVPDLLGGDACSNAKQNSRAIAAAPTETKDAARDPEAIAMGNQIREWRRNAGIIMWKAAEHLHLSVADYSGMEHGRRMPTDDELVRLKAFLGVTP